MDDARWRVAITGISSHARPAGRFYVAVQNAELACEVTLQPLRYPQAAAILFSDILTVPDAMGSGLYLKPGKLRVPRQSLARPTWMNCHSNPEDEWVT
ncbi:uroporphyrinogen decarboxylase family protein [Shigella flexneri]